MGFDLSGKVAVVTGAGSGIGRSCAQLLAAAGAEVVVADLADTAHETVRLITEAGGRATASVGDVSDEETAAALIAGAAAGGRLDVLVNNAGVMDLFAGAADVDTAMWERCLRVNATAPFFLTRAALPVMLEGGAGSIVNVASEAGIRGGAAGAAYTASKHAVVGLTRNTAFVYAQRGIRCNAVCPGGVETNIMSSIDPTRIHQEGMAALGPVHQTARGTATPEQIASLVLYLASDESANVNGAIIPNDGGWSAG
ncbi:MAG TPA: SDR family oxidoreductase [Nocardioides sp.]|uniref:SDR family oxidoreductase n=1 Tax=Nocardioides sp. TaxID=35761 RepID=UPI002BE2BBB4|nr:SDR family oxidoreductase [Nocardioides sp.]HQR25617.1 SDR family oxidoreductase [Nocardioides sp.]